MSFAPYVILFNAANIIAVSAAVIGLVLVSIVFIYAAIKQYNNAIQGTQDLMNDRELLLYIDSLPDRLIRSQDLAQHTGMTKTQASYRLQLLKAQGMLRVMYTDGFKSYYTLKKPLDKRPTPELSSAPYLTTEDILCIMQHYDFQVSMTDFVMATGLPIHILKKELQYFVKEKMITKLSSFDSNMSELDSKMYILKEPYRSNPERFLAREGEMNKELEIMYTKAKGDYDGLV